MEWSLLKAAEQGDTDQLKALLEEEPLLLQKLALSDYPDSPLHIATLAGRTHFVKEILHQMPSFAWDRNKDGLTPLHIASAMGYVNIVREILKASSPSLCLMKDKGGLTPLHYAAMRGRVEVIEELLTECPEAFRAVTADGETALHMAVVYSKFEALGVLVENLGYKDQEVIYAVDCHGNTIFQLAKSMKQLEVIKLLRSQGLMKQDRMANQSEHYHRAEHRMSKGMSLSIDVSELGNESKDGNNITAASVSSSLRVNQKQEEIKDEPPPPQKNSNSQKLLGGVAEEIVHVVASLVATATYGAVTSPPSTLWKDNMKLDTSCLFQHWSREPSLSESTKQCPAGWFYGFMGFNTAGFLCAVHLLLCRAHRIPVAVEFLFPTSIVMLVIAYLLLLISMTPDVGSFVIICSLAIGLIFYTFCPFAIKKFVAWFKEQNRESTPKVYGWSGEKPS